MRQRLFVLFMLCLAGMPNLFAQISNTATTITLSSSSFVPSQVCSWNNVASSGPGVSYEMSVGFEDGDDFGNWKILPASGYYSCTVTNTPNSNGPNIVINVPGAVFPTTSNTINGWDLAMTKGTVTLRKITSSGVTTYYQPWEYDQYVCSALPIFISSFTYSVGGDHIQFNWTAVDESDYLSHYTLQRSGNNFTWQNEILEPANTGLGTHNYSVKANKPGSNFQWYRLRWVNESGFVKHSASIQVFNTGTTPTNVACNYANITGDASACIPASKVYKLRNAPASGAVYSWSATGGTVSSTQQYGLKATISFSSASNATVYANSANSSCNKSKAVTVGGGEYINFYATNISTNINYTRYDLRVNMLPGTTGSQYSWFQDGYPLGTGQDISVYLYAPDECATIEVRITMPCGERTWNSSMCYMECEGEFRSAGKTPSDRVKISPVPAKDVVTISMLWPPCDESRLAAPGTKSSGSSLYTVQLYDMFGNLKLERRNVSLKSDLRLEVGTLPTGNYVLHIKNNEHTISKQVRIQR